MILRYEQTCAENYVHEIKVMNRELKAVTVRHGVGKVTQFRSQAQFGRRLTLLLFGLFVSILLAGCDGDVINEAAGDSGSSLPHVVSAVSMDNRTVLVSFSKPMSDSVIDPDNYSIVQANVNPEAGALGVTAA